MTYPTIRPELTLDFANSRQLDPRITFSRTSGATYLNPDTGLITLASEHEPRFEKDGLLIEQSRKNFYKKNNLDVKTQFQKYTDRVTVTPDYYTLDGTLNGALMEDDRTSDWNQECVIQNSFGSLFSTASTITVSIYLKPVVATGKINFYFLTSASGWLKGITWDTANPTATPTIFSNKDTIPGTVTNPFAQVLRDGWYRIGFTYDSGDLVAMMRLMFRNTPLGNKIIVGGLINIEEGSYPTSYIPTAGQTGGVTRDADIFQIAGDNFSSWYNPIKSTMVVNMSCKRSTGYGILWGFYGGGGRIEGYPGEGTPFAGLIFFYGDNNTQKYIGRGNADGEAVWNQEHKIEKCAYSWDFSSGEGTACISGNFAPISPPDTGVPMTTVTGGFRLMGGQNPSNVTNSGIVSSVAYYSQRLSDLELQTLTL